MEYYISGLTELPNLLIYYITSWINAKITSKAPW